MNLVDAKDVDAWEGRSVRSAAIDFGRRMAGLRLERLVLSEVALEVRAN